MPKKKDEAVTDEVLFVITDDGCPTRIHFDMEAATKEKEDYIDSFDSKGRPVRTYEKTDKDEYVVFADHTRDVAKGR